MPRVKKNMTVQEQIDLMVQRIVKKLRPSKSFCSGSQEHTATPGRTATWTCSSSWTSRAARQSDRHPIGLFSVPSTDVIVTGGFRVSNDVSAPSNSQRPGRQGAVCPPLIPSSSWSAHGSARRNTTSRTQLTPSLWDKTARPIQSAFTPSSVLRSTSRHYSFRNTPFRSTTTSGTFRVLLHRKLQFPNSTARSIPADEICCRLALP